MILKSSISPGLPLVRKVLPKKETKDQVLEKVIDLIAEKAAVETEEIEIIRIGVDQNMMIEVGIIFSMMIGPHQVIIDLTMMIGHHQVIIDLAMMIEEEATDIIMMKGIIMDTVVMMIGLIEVIVEVMIDHDLHLSMMEEVDLILRTILLVTKVNLLLSEPRSNSGKLSSG